MGFLDDFIAKVKTKAKAPQETLSPEEEEKVKELQSMFDENQKERVLQTYIKNNKNFEETLDELLKEPQNNTSNHQSVDSVDTNPNSSDEESTSSKAKLQEKGPIVQNNESQPSQPQNSPRRIIAENENNKKDEDEDKSEGEDHSDSKFETSDELNAQLLNIEREFEQKKQMVLKRLAKKEERRKKKIIEKEERRKSIPNSIPIKEHLERVRELEEAKATVENEKKKAMTWCLAQMATIQKQNDTQKETISQQKTEIDALRLQLKEKELMQTKYVNLLMHAKELIQLSNSKQEKPDEANEEFFRLLEKEIPDLDRLPVITSPLFERKREFPFAEDEIQMVMLQANISREKAMEALLKYKDVVLAILEEISANI